MSKKKKTNTLTITLEVPAEVDPEEVARIMYDDFYDMNRHSEDLGRHIDDISITWESWVRIELSDTLERQTA